MEQHIVPKYIFSIIQDLTVQSNIILQQDGQYTQNVEVGRWVFVIRALQIFKEGFGTVQGTLLSLQDDDNLITRIYG